MNGSGNTTRRFRTDYQRTDRHSAEEVNRIGRILNNARGEKGIEVQVTPYALIVRASATAGGLPAIPETGAHVLVAQNGVLSWAELQPFVCPA